MGWLGYMTVTTCCNNKDSGNLLPKDDSVWISDCLLYTSFRPLQQDVMTQEQINSYLEQCADIPFLDNGENYCTKIEVRGGYRIRNLELNKDTGTYTITAG